MQNLIQKNYMFFGNWDAGYRNFEIIIKDVNKNSINIQILNLINQI